VTTFDSDGDGVFEGITRMRVRTSVPVEFGNYRGLGPSSFQNRLSGIQVFLQALVKADIDVQEEGQELFVLQSHAYGETDANGVPNFELFPGDLWTLCGAAHSIVLTGCSTETTPIPQRVGVIISSKI